MSSLVLIPFMTVDPSATSSGRKDDVAIESPDGSSNNLFVGWTSEREFEDSSECISAAVRVSDPSVREQRVKNLKRVCFKLLTDREKVPIRTEKLYRDYKNHTVATRNQP